MARLRVPVQLRWSDMDAYAHVNNVAMLTLLEEARIQAFWRHPAASPVGDTAADAAADEAVAGSRADAWPTAVLDAGPGAELSTLVARQEIEYLRPLGYRRTPVLVEMWIGHLGGASLDVCYEVRDAPAESGGEVYARAVTTVVLVDTATGAPQRIGADVRAAWEVYLEEPVRLRRRR